jgi:hypothetical protein
VRFGASGGRLAHAGRPGGIQGAVARPRRFHVSWGPGGERSSPGCRHPGPGDLEHPGGLRPQGPEAQQPGVHPHGLSALNLAFGDRDFYYGDPAVPPEEPIKGLLSKEYAAERRKLINPERFLKKKYLDKAHAFYEKHSAFAVIIGRFLPVIRTFVPFVAGIGAMTYVDDAHGEGVIGEDGRGIGAHFHIEGKIDVEMGTFSKAYGVVGGLIAGSQDLVNFAYNKKSKTS